MWDAVMGHQREYSFCPKQVIFSSVSNFTTVMLHVQSHVLFFLSLDFQPWLIPTHISHYLNFPTFISKILEHWKPLVNKLHICYVKMSHVDYLGHFWPLRNLSHNMTPQLGPFHHHLQSWPCHILHGLSICVEDWSFFQILVGLNILCLSCSNILFILTWLHLLLSFLLAIRVKATLDSSVLHLSPSWIQTNNFTHALCCNASFFPFFPF